MKHKLVRTNDVHPHRGFNKWLALLITNGVGNMWFFYFLVAFIGGWIVLSKLGPLGFDPYPYALMLLIVGGIFQALAIVGIMVGQNVQAAASDARAETDHETLGGDSHVGRTVHTDSGRAEQDPRAPPEPAQECLAVIRVARSIKHADMRRRIAPVRRWPRQGPPRSKAPAT